MTRTVVLVYDDIMMERVSKALRKTFELKLFCDCQTVSNKIQIDNLYSVLEIVWTLTVKEEFIEMEKKCWPHK